MDRKMIFFDIDGTIVTERTHICPESTINAIRRARENGHLAFINTGRTYFNVTEDIRSIGFDGYICGCGTYINRGDKALLHRSIPHEECVDIVKKLRQYKVQALFEGLNDIFFDHTAPATGYIAVLRDEFGARGFDVSKSWDDPNIEFDKFVVWIDENSDYESFYSYITNKYDYIDRGKGFGEIIPKGYSKATGIQYLQRYFNIPLNNCYAIGDSTNDLPMLKYAGNSIAMGNSTPVLFDSVSFVTKDIEEDGIEYALKHYGII